MLKGEFSPKDDMVPWLFLVIDEKGERRFSFFYKIENPLDAQYEVPFSIRMSF